MIGKGVEHKKMAPAIQTEPVIQEDRVKAVEVFFRDENLDMRPDPGAVLALMKKGLTLEEIKEAGKRSGMEYPFATLDDETHLLQESRTVAECLMLSLTQAKKDYPGATILTLSRDADPIFDVATALNPQDTNVFPFPGSSVFWERWGKDIQHYDQPYYGSLKLLLDSVDLLNPSKRFVIFDAALKGSIARTIKEHIVGFRALTQPEKTHEELTQETEQRVTNALIYSIAFHDTVQIPTYPYKPRHDLFPVTVKDKKPSKYLSFNMALGEALQRLPKFHQRQKYFFRDLDQSGGARVEFEDGPTARDVGQFYRDHYHINAAPVNRLAALLVQYTMMAQVLKVKALPNWEEGVRNHLEHKDQRLGLRRIFRR